MYIYIYIYIYRERDVYRKGNIEKKERGCSPAAAPFVCYTYISMYLSIYLALYLSRNLSM